MKYQLIRIIQKRSRIGVFQSPELSCQWYVFHMIVRAVVIMTSNYKKTGRMYETKKKKKRNHVIFLFLFCISTFGTKDIKKGSWNNGRFTRRFYLVKSYKCILLYLHFSNLGSEWIILLYLRIGNWMSR